MTTDTVPPAVTDSQLQAARERAEAAERKADMLRRELATATQQREALSALVAEMDDNRETLGDACRSCGQRVWAGPNGLRRPHHTEACPVAIVRAGGKVKIDERGDVVGEK